MAMAITFTDKLGDTYRYCETCAGEGRLYDDPYGIGHSYQCGDCDGEGKFCTAYDDEDGESPDPRHEDGQAPQVLALAA